ncbi:MAG: hypothetical protein ACI9KN_001294 [Gammaproteobacteria bacterium]|jgi:hypothetical protein
MELEMPDFDNLMQMAQNHPYQLERLRAQLTEQMISSAPESLQPRLRGLQFQIDCRRKLSKTPMSACIHITNMMHQSLEELRLVLNDSSAQTSCKASSNADILPFPSSPWSPTKRQS